MGITFKESVAEVELGLAASDQLPDIAASGLLEGYESTALANLAARLDEPFDPVEVERLWRAVQQELNLTPHGPTMAAKILVRAYARLVVEGELPPQLGASKIAGLHRITEHRGCDARATGDCIDAAGVIRVFYTQHGRGYVNQSQHAPFDAEIVDECRRIAAMPLR